MNFPVMECFHIVVLLICTQVNDVNPLFTDPPLRVREEQYDNVGDKLAGLKRMVPLLPPSAPPPLPVALSMHRPTSACGKAFGNF